MKYSEYNDFVGYRTFIGTFFTKENSPFEKTKGYQLNPGIISTQRIENIRKYYPQSKVYPDPEYLNYFQKIIDLSLANNIKVILINTPEYYRIYEFQKNRSDIYDLYKKIADDKEIEFFWMEDSVLCADKSKFKDISHLNVEGAVSYTKLLSKFLRENYE